MAKEDFVNRTNAILAFNETGSIEGPDLAALLIANFDDHVEDAVAEALAKSFAKKPVLSMVNELPTENRALGMRYFLTSGDNIFNIAEWMGANWNYTTLIDGDQVFCISSGLFIIRNNADYNLSQAVNAPPVLTGDVVFNEDGTTAINDKAVTLAKMADMATASVYYRKSNGNGPPEVKALSVLKTDLEIFTLKPVISICSELPEINLSVGDRYFIVSGENALKIAEWNGNAWNASDTAEGNSFYSYMQKNFIIRKADGFDIAAGNVPFADNFTDEITNEIMTGACNGLNRIFRTSVPFKLNTIIVFINGLNDKGFTALDNQTIQLDEAPVEGDVILAVFNNKII